MYGETIGTIETEQHNDIFTTEEALTWEFSGRGIEQPSSTTEYAERLAKVLVASANICRDIRVEKGDDEIIVVEDITRMCKVGKLRDFDIPRVLPDRPQTDWGLNERLIRVLNIYAASPDLMLDILESKITGAHGTSSASLMGILEHGVVNFTIRKDLGAYTLAGEKGSAAPASERYVSFFTWDSSRQPKRYSELAVRLNRSPDTFASERLKLRTAIDNLNVKLREKPEYSSHIKGLIYGAEMELWDIEETQKLLDKQDKTPKEAMQTQLVMENFPVIMLSRWPRNPLHRLETQLTNTYEVEGGCSPTELPIIAVPKDKFDVVHDVLEIIDWKVRVYDIDAYSSTEVSRKAPHIWS